MTTPIQRLRDLAVRYLDRATDVHSADRAEFQRELFALAAAAEIKVCGNCGCAIDEMAAVDKAVTQLQLEILKRAAELVDRPAPVTRQDLEHAQQNIWAGKQLIRLADELPGLVTGGSFA